MKTQWPDNSLTEKLKLDWPIFLSPMAELTTPELSAAVSSKGGLGSLGMWGFSIAQGEQRIQTFRQLSNGSLNLNYPLWQGVEDLTNQNLDMQFAVQSLYDELGLGKIKSPKAPTSEITGQHLETILKTRPEVISFHFGLPNDNTLKTIQGSGIYVMCSATTVAEAVELEQRGVDFIIAQGLEAGGHRGTFTGVETCKQSGLFSLLPQIVDAVSIPVIAAGGIADGRGIAAAFVLGASAVQLGTAFLRCPEAYVLNAHRRALESATEASTVITNLISGTDARFIENKLIRRLSETGLKPMPFPAQYDLTLPLGDSDDPDYSDLLSGQSVAMTREMSASELMETLITETNQIFSIQ